MNTMYCTSAALEMGASKVVSFEMYREVLQLASKNPFSPSLKDPRIVCQQRVAAFFQELTKLKVTYDACIIDPAKKKVMEKVYSPRFLNSLSDYLTPDAHVAAYVPGAGIAQKFQDLRKDIITTFESTQRFKYTGNYKDHEFIFCFKRVK